MILVAVPTIALARKSTHVSAKSQARQLRAQRREAKFRACMEGKEESAVLVELRADTVKVPESPSEEELDYFREYGWTIKKDTGYVNKEPFSITLVEMKKYGGYPVEIKTAIAFDKMAQAARKKGIHLSLNSGFRTQESQKKLRAAWCSHRRAAIAGPPGRSLHQAGYALDINVRERGAMRFLNRHAHTFHFYRTVCSESWHWEYSPTGEPLVMQYGCMGRKTKKKKHHSPKRTLQRKTKNTAKASSKT